jgi:hypothetical protein
MAAKRSGPGFRRFEKCLVVSKLGLIKKGLLTKAKSGKTMVFRASHDLSERIKRPHIARGRL